MHGTAASSKAHRPSIIAAIPNYNMRESLAQLLPSLLKEKFDAIYVLDDASEDGSADYIAASFPQITVVPGDRNVGAGANRNRILPHLSGNELILFIDADMQLRSEHLAEAVERWFARPGVGIVGGLIIADSGEPMGWNYGPAMSPAHDYRTEVYTTLTALTTTNSRQFDVIRRMALAKGDTYNFEIQCAPPVVRKVDWVAEGLFAICGNLFKEIDGYDERFRCHDNQDLGVRVKAAGYGVYFDPAITALHLDIDVRGQRRSEDFRESKFLFYQKHWGMSREVFERLFP